MNYNSDKDKNLFLEGLLNELKKEHHFNKYEEQIAEHESEDLVLQRDFFGNARYEMNYTISEVTSTSKDIEGYIINKANIHSNYMKHISYQYISSQVEKFAEWNNISVMKEESQIFLEFEDQKYELTISVGNVPSDSLKINLEQTFSFNI